MKVGMNSQTLRIVWGNGNITDYHITDGTTASKFMKCVGGVKPTEATLGDYEDTVLLNETDPMSWGSDTDKMTDINFTEVGRSDEEGMIDSQSRPHDNYGYYAPSQPARRSPVGTTFHQPMSTCVKQTPPPPRHDYSKTSDNEKNFKKLFGA